MCFRHAEKRDAEESFEIAFSFGQNKLPQDPAVCVQDWDGDYGVYQIASSKWKIQEDPCWVMRESGGGGDDDDDDST